MLCPLYRWESQDHGSKMTWSHLESGQPRIQTFLWFQSPGANNLKLGCEGKSPGDLDTSLDPVGIIESTHSQILRWLRSKKIQGSQLEKHCPCLYNIYKGGIQKNWNLFIKYCSFILTCLNFTFKVLSDAVFELDFDGF